jgi:hypothetical protein
MVIVFVILLIKQRPAALRLAAMKKAPANLAVDRGFGGLTH